MGLGYVGLNDDEAQETNHECNNSSNNCKQQTSQHNSVRFTLSHACTHAGETSIKPASAASCAVPERGEKKETAASTRDSNEIWVAKLD